MKKIVLFAAMSLALAAPSLAQTKVVKQVERIVKSDEPDFNQARQLLQPTFQDEESKNQAYTWYVAGLLEEKIVEKNKIAMSLAKPFDELAFYNALYDMYPLYLKADELDAMPNEKGKVKRKYEKQIRKAISDNHGFLINAGSFFFDKQDFANAHKFFKKYLEIKGLPMFAGTPTAEQDSTSMQIGFFAAYSASQIKDNIDTAIKEYESIKHIPYRQSDVYQLLASAYSQKEDSVNYLNTLEEGASLFPEDKFFLFNLINIYIRQGQNDQAKAFLEKGLAQDPQNKQLYMVLASVYEQGYKDIAKAEEAYAKSLAIDPQYADAIIGLGRIYYNQAVEVQSEANAISDAKKIKELDAKAAELFKKALPYFEKAIAIDSSNTEYLMALRGIYYNLKMDDKMAEIEKKLGM